MAKKSYFYRVEYARDGGKAYGLQTVCGYTCMENDRLFRMLDTPELKVGDRIIYEKVGAYTMCLTPLFIQYFPSVYVEDGQEIYQVRTHWGEKEYCQGSCLGGKK
jgi:diaminopimelate decarboxylase